MRLRALRTVAIVLAALVVLSAPTPAYATGSAGQRLDVEVVSSPRGDLVTGGDMLVRVTPGRGGGDRIRVFAGGRDVSEAFVAQPDGTLLGLVTGLPVGHTLLLARSGWFGAADAVLVRNHPRTGPVFSGPQQVPFFCETTVFGLAPAQQPHCEAPSVVGYLYRTTGGQFRPLANPNDRPADLAQATVDGRAVPYVVRVERGTIDRAVYEIAALHDGSDPSPTRAHGAWNRRLVYTFGGGCNVGYHQGAGTGGVIDNLFLSQGYAVASSTLNVLDNNCSTIISAEVAMMVKEHVIETYGPVAHTIGWGGSGGAIQQYGIADNYPGILDGIIPQVSFPDALSVGAPVADCRLLNRFFTAAGAAYTDAQRRAVSGFLVWGSCVSWDLFFASRGHAMQACPPAIPAAFLFHPVTNPDGIKCTTAEQLVNQLGRDPLTGFARSPLDNVGVQYGLAALASGALSAEQFVEINERIGGFDTIGDFAPARSEADRVALIRAYRSGLVLSGRGGLARTPIIDLRAYTDPFSDIHTKFWSSVVRERLIGANGHAANQVILTASAFPTPANPQAYALSAMDQWLTAGRRPAELVDACWNATGALVVDAAACEALYPTAGDTRLVAGAPLRDNILKCALKPLNPATYPVPFSAAQQARLRAAFPEGVCDYTRRGVGQMKLAGTWQRY